MDDKEFSKNDNDSTYYSKTELRETLEDYLDILHLVQKHKKEQEKKIQELGYLEKEKPLTSTQAQTQRQRQRSIQKQIQTQTIKSKTNQKKIEKKKQQYQLACTIRSNRQKLLNRVLSKNEKQKLSQLYSPSQILRVLKKRKSQLIKKKVLVPNSVDHQNVSNFQKSKSFNNFEKKKEYQKNKTIKHNFTEIL
ncbi:hypothetical protein M0812_25702 [Anaeramoeba flamelloides]|uniref:Uncharacterized protein n=1 Tax=Anaeramoeba flamelloides TaxID=1746091 RepID=A0AAV7YHS2_9EUKA|nr:hypothetical protein M0812_25702 [Anaeramoeba flamelloides]